VDPDERYDLAVIGAGPGGLQAAVHASKRGLKVVLIERQSEIGYPIQTSGGSYLDDLDELGIPERFLHRLEAVVFASTTRQVEVRYPSAAACVIDVRGTYQHLALNAARHGCRIWVRTTARGPIISGGRVTGVDIESGGPAARVSSRFVIDASGITGVTLRPCGLLPSPGDGRMGVGLEYEAFVEHPDPSRAYLLMSSKFAPGGYAWVFPCSQDRARLGVGILKPDSAVSPAQLLGRLLASPHPLISALGRIEPIEYHGGSIPVEPVLSRVTFPGLLVLGDAARQSNPVVGEGIRQAMTFGRAAAETVADIFEDVTSEDDGFRSYEAAAQRHATSLAPALELNRAMAGYDDDHWDNLARLLEILSPEEVRRILRGELSRSFLAKIAVKHPRFMASQTVRRLRAAGGD
jgi:digeranylgeranylglycerophospholipid reductase